MNKLNWRELDILLISGDAYLDHPASGTALLGRWLVHHGYRTGIITPTENIPAKMKEMGRPLLFAGISAGSMDSTMAHYTPFRKIRSDDPYTPGGMKGPRPNRASIVYAGLIKQAFPGLPVVLGGLEASIRRFSHFDFMQDAVRRPISFDARADVLIWGMAEKTILRVAAAFASNGINALEKEILPGTVVIRSLLPDDTDRFIELPSHESIIEDINQLMDLTLKLNYQANTSGLTAVQRCNNRFAISGPPSSGLTTDELDLLYSLPFTRLPHPSIKKRLPAFEMLKSSITAHRGCAGGCSFCAIGMHQGRNICSRSAESIIDEVERMIKTNFISGSISDVGGPTANMWNSHCSRKDGGCIRTSCLFPDICTYFKTDQSGYGDLLASILKLKGVKNVRVASGIRHDLALRAPDFSRELVSKFIGGQIKLAPEHADDRVLRLMQKPSFEITEEFLRRFYKVSKKSGKEQHPVLYLMSAHPGSTAASMRILSDKMKKLQLKPRQIQCFTPIPGTISSAMFACGTNTKMRTIPVARNDRERISQHRIIAPDQKRNGKKR